MSVRTASHRLSFIPFCSPTLVAEPPAGDDWIHEIKHDGYRTMLVIERGSIRAFTRNGHDWSERYHPVTVAASKLDCRSAIIDGEMIVQRRDGRSDFEALSRAIRRAPKRLVFFAFDLLHRDGRDLQCLPVLERRAELGDVLPDDPRSPIQLSEHVTDGGPAFFKAAEKMGLEGIVSKRVDSRYRSGPSKRWLKTKCWTESEFRIVGAEIDRRGIPMAILAGEKAGELRYAGGAVISLTGSDRTRLAGLLDRFSTDRSVLRMKRPGARWLKQSDLRVRVKHLKGGRFLRHASVKAFCD